MHDLVIRNGTIVDGKILQTAAENLDYLTPLADKFLREELPFLKKLGVV